MPNYRNILNIQMEEYNKEYKQICREKPSMSLRDKSISAIRTMLERRNLQIFDMMSLALNPIIDLGRFTYSAEVYATYCELEEGGIDRYYLVDDSLFDFFRQTEVKSKEVLPILEALDKKEEMSLWGVIGKNFSFTLLYTKIMKSGEHILSILTDEMNYVFCVEWFNDKEKREIFNMAMNFLFYISAFPECVVDGVPNGVKRNSKAKVISTSDKIISHKTVEHGFVRPHFRSGYFRHLNSDYFVNCKGQVRFIASTMVKGKAKTVISRKGE